MIKINLQNKFKFILLASVLTLSFLAALFVRQSFSGQAAPSAGGTPGRILLQVEKNGEAWYVYPNSGQRYFLGRPAEAFAIMRQLSLGAKHDFILNTDIFPARLAGLILLDVEANGEAYYIYPVDLKKYYLGRPADAFKIMRELGLGISNSDLALIPIGDVNRSDPEIYTGKILIGGVPFTSQAPAGDWSDDRQQNGCEEASALMAISWARGQTFTAGQALNQITGISDFLAKKYGEYRDTSAQDTLDWIIKDYFGYTGAELIKNVTIAGMVEQLNQGRVLIAPMNGQLLGNPNFTAPGPARHMAVITGYDPDKRVFITNDPGTRRGQDYQYDLNVFYNAMRDYPTGDHAPITAIEKNIIAVWR